MAQTKLKTSSQYRRLQGFSKNQPLHSTHRRTRQGTSGRSCTVIWSYDELMLTSIQFAYARDLDGTRVIVSVNNDDAPAGMHLAAGNCTAYIGALSGEKVSVQDGHINITQPANSGEIWVPEGTDLDVKPVNVYED